MSRAIYALIPTMPFCVPINPGAAAKYTHANPADLTPLTRTEQASIDTAFARQKHYFLSMQNIKQAYFNALDTSMNDAFKVLNGPAMTGWHRHDRTQDFGPIVLNL
jgi:hypothetical protein